MWEKGGIWGTPAQLEGDGAIPNRISSQQGKKGGICWLQHPKIPAGEGPGAHPPSLALPGDQDPVPAPSRPGVPCWNVTPELWKWGIQDLVRR